MLKQNWNHARSAGAKMATDAKHIKNSSKIMLWDGFSCVSNSKVDHKLEPNGYGQRRVCVSVCVSICECACARMCVCVFLYV